MAADGLQPLFLPISYAKMLECTPHYAYQYELYSRLSLSLNAQNFTDYSFQHACLKNLPIVLILFSHIITYHSHFILFALMFQVLTSIDTWT